MKFFAFFIVFFSFFVSAACGESTPSTKLISALAQVESTNGKKQVGDKHLVNKAYGDLQVRKTCLDDVNKAAGTNYKPEDCIGNRELSEWVFKRYMKLWATKKRLGRKPTDEDYARIWNGGPDGWKKDSTLGYWEKVKKALASK